MRALRFNRKGELAALQIEDVPAPVLGPDEVLVRVRAAAINPSDVKNVLGHFPQTHAPRTPGRDFAGVVEAGPPGWVGREVFGSGGGLGFTQDGSHAELVSVPIDGVVDKGKHLTFEQAASVGLGYLTAWSALVSAGNLRPGETALLLGVTGAVGSAAAAIGRRLGARLLGTVRSANEVAAASTLVDQVLNLGAGELPNLVMEATGGRGADLILDVVGGPLFEPCMRALAHRGRHLVISSTGSPQVSFDLRDFYRREGRLLGVDTLKLSLAESAAILRQLVPGFEDGSYPPPLVKPWPLKDAVAAYTRIHEGKAAGKIVLVP